VTKRNLTEFPHPGCDQVERAPVFPLDCTLQIFLRAWKTGILGHWIRRSGSQPRWTVVGKELKSEEILPDQDFKREMSDLFGRDLR
jgi:hypothetical protein